MASLVTTSRMQQCFNVLIDIYHEFLLLFYCCVLLEIKLTTTTTTTTTATTTTTSTTKCHDYLPRMVTCISVECFNSGLLNNVSRIYIMAGVHKMCHSPTHVCTGEGCVSPQIFFEYIELILLQWNSLSLCLHLHPRYSAGMFNVLWLVVLLVPEAVYWSPEPVGRSTNKLVWTFDTVDFFLYLVNRCWY